MVRDSLVERWADVPTELKMRPTTEFKREFKAFLAGIGFKLKHFLPADDVDEPMFTDCLIPHSTGYERLRGTGRLTEELARLWARRSDRFLSKAFTDFQRSGQKPSLDGISFVDLETGQPRVSWRKLISLYEVEPVPIQIILDGSIDDVKLAAILAVIRPVVGDTEIAVVRVWRRCMEIVVLVSRQKADEIRALFSQQPALGALVEVKEIAMPTEGSVERGLWLDGPAIDLREPDAFTKFEDVWRRAVRIESLIRPWRRLQSLPSPSLFSRLLLPRLYRRAINAPTPPILAVNGGHCRQIFG